MPINSHFLAVVQYKNREEDLTDEILILDMDNFQGFIKIAVNFGIDKLDF
jgi:hypothetical protein